MRTRIASCVMLGVLLLPTAGCLSLGGGTTYVQEKPETGVRLAELESRVNRLEQGYVATDDLSVPVGSQPSVSAGRVKR